jgi:hypothetical protein
MWAVSYLRNKIFARFEPYIMHYLEKEIVALYDKIVTDVINIIGYYLALLLQSFGDLDKCHNLLDYIAACTSGCSAGYTAIASTGS